MSARWVSPGQVPSSGKGGHWGQKPHRKGHLILPMWSSGTGVPFHGRIPPSAPEGEQCPRPAHPPQSPASCFPVTASSRLPPWDVGHFSHCAAWLTATPTRGQEGDSSRGRRHPRNLAPCSLDSEIAQSGVGGGHCMLLLHGLGCQRAASPAGCQISEQACVCPLRQHVYQSKHTAAPARPSLS